MERKITDELTKWKDSKNRMPLILYGARQVGKTYTLLSFGRKYFKNTVYLNMEDSGLLASVFDRDFNPKRILRELSTYSGQSIFPGDTLIFFDEIQACERALSSLKYFCESVPEYYIVAAGSLLGIMANLSKYTFPLGRVTMKTLYPLDFEEFLTATGTGSMIGSIAEAFQSNKPFSGHMAGLDLYKTYLVTGGMPHIVSEYITTEDFNFVLAAQKNISDIYIADMAKLATPTETTKIMAAFNSVPAQLSKENKKFQYSIIKSGARAYDYEASIDWLRASGMITKCVKAKEGKPPLSAQADNGSFKLYMADVGLLCSKFGIPANVIISDVSGSNNYMEALTENYIATGLMMNGHQPYYWESAGKAEIDFLIQNQNGEIIPIEVKASDNVRSKSLKQYTCKYNPPYSIRISSKNFSFEAGIKSIPPYAVFLI